jgi:thymidylate synthase ThyX
VTTIKAKIIADSIALGCPRLTTMELTYPRFIHSEFMAHRVFSRNASSSRATPVERQIRMIEENPATPLYWGKNQKGMQATQDCSELVSFLELEYADNALVYGDNDGKGKELLKTNEEAWLVAKDNAVKVAKAFNTAGYHKQIVNRLLEPFSHITVVVTATDWDNFFELRLHKDAEPHMQHLARVMYEEMDNSTPIDLSLGEYHLPYVTSEDWSPYYHSGSQYSFEEVQEYLIKVSVARCARTSYLNHDGSKSSHDKDIELHDKLVVSKPIHASPAEHQATPMAGTTPKWAGNLRGWKQYRKIIENG